MNVLGMFVRRPEAGRTKTRLAATIGATVAAQLYAAFVDDLLRRCPALADRFLLAATPDDQATADWFLPRLADNSQLVFQPDGELGQRIEWFFRFASAAGGHSIVLIGSDSPDLPSAWIVKAFRRLSEVDVVIGPATDGGYVLIGLRKPHANLFDGISWSSPTTLSETTASAAQQGLSVELLQPWYDIDVVQDLRTLKAHQETADSEASDCPATLAALTRYWSEISLAIDQI